MQKMTKLVFLTVMLSLKTLLEENKVEKTIELIDRLVNEAEKNT